MDIQVPNMIKKLTDNTSRLDLIVGGLGCLSGFGIIWTGLFKGVQATTEIGFALFLGSFLYLLLQNRRLRKVTVPSCASFPFKSYYQPIFLFFLVFSNFIFLVDTIRSPLYFLIIAFLISLVGIQIISSTHICSSSIILLEIILISISLRSSLFYEVPGFLGNDGGGHQNIINTWINNGRLTNEIPTIAGGYSNYSGFPIMHLLVISLNLLLSVNLKDSLFISVGLINAFVLIFIFILGKRVLDHKSGLLAALLISFNPSNIGWGVILIPNSLGLSFFTIIISILIQG